MGVTGRFPPTNARNDPLGLARLHQRRRSYRHTPRSRRIVHALQPHSRDPIRGGNPSRAAHRVLPVPRLSGNLGSDGAGSLCLVGGVSLTRPDATPQDVLLECPVCHTQAGALVPGVSAISRMVDYFRCHACAHVWTADKSDRSQADDDALSV